MTRLSRESGTAGHPIEVALDTGFLALPPSGIGSYVAGLRDALMRRSDVQVVPIHPPEQLQRLGARGMRFAWDALLVEARRRKHAPDADLLHIPAFSAPLVSQAPLVVTVHDVIPFVLSEYRASGSMRGYLELMRRTVRKARVVVTPSAAAAGEIERVLGIAASRIRVTPLAADPAFRPPDDVPAVSREAWDRFSVEGRYLLTMAGFDRRKNVPLLVEAFARSLPSLPDDVMLVLAGAAHSDNPTVFPPVEPVIARHGIENRVRLTGRVSDADRLLLYQAAHAYVTPSVYEGFGLTPLEAMASGVPVIVANRTSLPEVVGDAGVLVEPDVDALAGAIVALVEDEGLRSDLRERGLQRAATFTWDLTAELTVAAYRDALS